MAKERIYVEVNLQIDCVGTVIPKEIVWSDGRTFTIDRVLSASPAEKYKPGVHGSCFIVTIMGQEKPLFLEKVDDRFPGRYFRWFVERER